MEVATAGLLAGLASASASALNSGLNIGITNKMNARQEALMRESWAREDNAVQRRVADLKAAGLSPTLAAGSAAASSGPINLQTPKADFGGVVDRYLEAKSAVNALKVQEVQLDNLKKQGELLELNKDYYGYPDWAIAGIRMFGMEGFRDMVRQIGSNLFGLLGGSTPSVPVNHPTIGAPLSRPNLKTDLSMAGAKPYYDPLFGSSTPSVDKKVAPLSGVDNSNTLDLQNKFLKGRHDALYDELSSFAVGQAKPLTLDGVYDRYVQELMKEGFEKDMATGIVSNWISHIMDELGYTYDKNDKKWFYDH